MPTFEIFFREENGHRGRIDTIDANDIADVWNFLHERLKIIGSPHAEYNGRALHNDYDEDRSSEYYDYIIDHIEIRPKQIQIKSKFE